MTSCGEGAHRGDTEALTGTVFVAIQQCLVGSDVGLEACASGTPHLLPVNRAGAGMSWLLLRSEGPGTVTGRQCAMMPLRTEAPEVAWVQLGLLHSPGV